MIKRIRHWLQATEPAAAQEAAALRVLMVCMGNICRSPTAEGVLRAKLQRAGLAGRVLVDSAGTLGSHSGEPPDPRAVRHAAQRGYDIAGLRARAVTADDFTRFDAVSVTKKPEGHLPSGSIALPKVAQIYFTSRLMFSEWLLNSGAYRHWMLAKPVGYLPRCCTRNEYSNT